MTCAETIFNLNELEQEVALGFVSKRKHPELPLWIYNYTPEATYSNRWNPVTRACRGLILDGAYNIVARPFQKFFNLDTSFEPSTHRDNLPLTSPLVMEKLDGSLGILWRYGNQSGVATRGSFDSEQARWATNQWKSMSGLLRWNFDFGYDTTPCLEIIYPGNRIVVDYGKKEDLVLLGIVRNNDGSEYSYDEMLKTGYPHVVQVYTGKSLSDCVAESELDLPVNAEGYVLLFPPELTRTPYPLRIKIKFQDYLRLHRMTFNLSDRLIWEGLSQGIHLTEKMEGLPKDAQDWIYDTENELQRTFNLIKGMSETIFKNKPEGSRKEIAQYFCGFPRNYQSVLFGMLDGKDIDQIIWKQLRPEKTELFRKAFSEEA